MHIASIERVEVDALGHIADGGNGVVEARHLRVWYGDAVTETSGAATLAFDDRLDAVITAICSEGTVFDEHVGQCADDVISGSGSKIGGNRVSNNDVKQFHTHAPVADSVMIISDPTLAVRQLSNGAVRAMVDGRVQVGIVSMAHHGFAMVD